MFLLLAVAGAFAQDSTTLIVDFRDTMTEADVTQFNLVDPTAEIFLINESEQLYMIHTPSTDLVTTLWDSKLVETIEFDQVFSIPEQEISEYPWVLENTKGDPLLSKQWHMTHESIQAPWMWQNTKAGKGVVVAVLDTGLTVTKDTRPDGVSSKGKSFVGGALTDRNGHGTHCASTISEWTNNGVTGAGVAPNATILPIKVLSDGGSGGVGGIVNGILYATEQGADVISMSLGSSQPSPAIHKALDEAMAAGVVVVAAAGNSGQSGRNSVGFPGGYDPVIGVGSIGPEGKRAFYSSYGKGLDLMAPGGDKSLGEAGGVWQQTAPRDQDGFYSFQGTSMATPHMAGAVAVLLSEGACPKKDATRQKCIEKLLTETAQPAPTNDRDREYGNGTIRLRTAVEKVKAATEANTTTPVTLYQGAHSALQQDLYEMVPVLATPSGGLPHPSPAGNYTFLVTAISLGLGLLLAKQNAFPNRFIVVATSTAVALSGPLFILTKLNIGLLPVAPLVVPILEWPEYLIGKGASGCAFWQSPLPLVVPFLLLPLRPLRPIVVGALIAFTSYIGLNGLLQFNPLWCLWWLGGFGAGIWLIGSTAILLGMSGVFIEFYRLNVQEGK